MKKILKNFLFAILLVLGIANLGGWSAKEVKAAEGDATYKKVTAALDDWSGEYLIVYEEGKLAFNGSLSTLDAIRNNVSVTIQNDMITASPNYSFTIAKSSGTSYSIQSASGKYIGSASNTNGLASSDTSSYNHEITFNTGDVLIKASTGAVLRYNATSGQERFRYFKSSSYTNQKAIQLYKKAGVESVSISGAPTEKVLTGTEVQLTANITPSNIDAQVTWSVDKTEVASVSENGLVKGLTAGSVVVTATVEDKSDTVTIEFYQDANADQEKANEVVGFIDMAESLEELTEVYGYYNALTDAQKELVSNKDVLFNSIATILNDELATLPEVDVVTIEDKANVVAVETKMNPFKEDTNIMALVSNAEKVNDLLNKIQELEVAEKDKADALKVDALIENIGEVVDYSKVEQISEARAAYDALNDAAKGYVKNLDLLVAAEEAILKFKPLVAKYEITTTTSVSKPADAPSYWDASFINTYSANKFQLTKGNSMTFKLNNFDRKLSKVVLSMRTNSGSGTGTILIKVGNTEVFNGYHSEYHEITGNPTEFSTLFADHEFNVNGLMGNITIEIKAETNSLYCESFEFHYEEVKLNSVIEKRDDNSLYLVGGIDEQFVNDDNLFNTLSSQKLVIVVTVDGQSKTTEYACDSIYNSLVDGEYKYTSEGYGVFGLIVNELDKVAGTSVKIEFYVSVTTTNGYEMTSDVVSYTIR